MTKIKRPLLHEMLLYDITVTFQIVCWTRGGHLELWGHLICLVVWNSKSIAKPGLCFKSYKEITKSLTRRNAGNDDVSLIVDLYFSCHLMMNMCQLYSGKLNVSYVYIVVK